MEEKKLMPKRRFREFQNEGNWKQSRMKEVVDVYDGTHQTPKYTKSGVMFLSVENIQSLKSNKYISYKDFERDFKIFPEMGDVLMTRIGDIGTANVVESDENKAYYVTLALLKKRGLDPYFLKENIHSVSIRKELWHRTLHIAFPKKINMDEIGKVLIKYPGAQEQQKIGEFFKMLDEQIANQMRKIAKVKALKSAYLTEMFPQEGETVPKRRFKGFDGEWLLSSVKDIGNSYKGGGTPNTSISKYWNGNIPWIQSSDLNEHLVKIKHPGNKITRLGLQKSATKLIPANSIAVVTRVGVGKLVFIPYEYTTSQDFLSISNLNVEFNFGAYALYNLLQKEKESVQGTSIKGMTKNELLSMKLLIPTDFNEQQKIGEFFNNLDDQIATEGKKLDKLQKMKEAYLEEMFV